MSFGSAKPVHLKAARREIRLARESAAYTRPPIGCATVIGYYGDWEAHIALAARELAHGERPELAKRVLRAAEHRRGALMSRVANACIAAASTARGGRVSIAPGYRGHGVGVR